MTRHPRQRKEDRARIKVRIRDLKKSRSYQKEAYDGHDSSEEK